MSTLERYKKEGGFYQLLLLIENSDPEKQQRFLQMIRQESAVWADAIEEKRFTMEKLISLPQGLLTYALELIPPRIIAIALWNLSPDMRQKFLSYLNSVIQKKVENTWTQEPEPRIGDINACQIKFFQSIRQVLNDKRNFWSQIPEQLRIPDHYEQILNRESLKAAFLSTTASENKTISTADHADKTSESMGDSETSKLLLLNKQLEVLMQENQRLKKEVTELKDRLQQIKKLVA